MEHFNPLAPRGARPETVLGEGLTFDISIHSPLAGRDWRALPTSRALSTFQSTRPSRGETRWTGWPCTCRAFQSTRPSRGETPHGSEISDPVTHFNPLAPRGARLDMDVPSKVPLYISIHSPLAGRDQSFLQRVFTGSSISIHSPLAGRDRAGGDIVADHDGFQSTRHSRGETHLCPECGRKMIISIHSPLAGRDIVLRYIKRRTRYFNPLAPRGARQEYIGQSLCRSLFQSTRPSRGETSPYGDMTRHAWIFQSTRPSRGETHPPCGFRFPGFLFQSTRPSRGETHDRCHSPLVQLISIHSPLAGRDRTASTAIS